MTTVGILNLKHPGVLATLLSDSYLAIMHNTAEDTPQHPRDSARSRRARMIVSAAARGDRYAQRNLPDMTAYLTYLSYHKRRPRDARR